MRRSLSTLRRWAATLEHDAHNALDGVWNVDVDDSYVLTVRRDHLFEQVALGEEVDEHSWPQDAWSPPYIRTTLDAEAAEAVTDEFLEVLRLWGVSWTSCSQHDNTISPCSGVWTCAGPEPHDIALIGHLPAPSDGRLTELGVHTHPQQPGSPKMEKK